MRHSWRDVLSALVALSLAVPTCAAPVDGEAAAARKEDLEFLYQTLERARPDLFANTPEERSWSGRRPLRLGWRRRTTSPLPWSSSRSLPWQGTPIPPWPWVGA